MSLLRAPAREKALAVSVQRADALVWQRDAAGKETEWRRMTFQMERRAPKREDRRAETKKVSNGYGWGWAAACILLAVGGIWMVRVEPPPLPAASMTLELEGGKDELGVHWRENGMGRLESAAMVVRQGSEEETLDLTDDFRPAGGLKVRLKAQEVVVSLRVRRQEQPVIARTVTYVEPLRAKAHREAGGAALVNSGFGPVFRRDPAGMRR